MKLRNKITGEIRNAVDIDMYTDSVYLKVSDGEFDNETIEYHSLAELNEEWEDVSKEEVWYLGKRIGNYSMPIKEADIVAEKILAWKRLKDKGFRFNGWIREHKKGSADITIVSFIDEDYDITNDLNLLFGGKE